MDSKVQKADGEGAPADASAVAEVAPSSREMTELQACTEGINSHTLKRRRDSMAKRINANKSRLRIVPEALSREYAVPVRLTALQRKQYFRILREASESPSAVKVKAEQVDGDVEDGATMGGKLIARLDRVLLHPKLAENSASPESKKSEKPWSLVQSSSKLELLVDIIEALRTQPVRLAILYDDEHVLKILQTVLDELTVLHVDLGADDAKLESGDLEVLSTVLVPSDRTDILPSEPIDLSIAMTKHGKCSFASLLRLVVANSSEHVARQSSDEKFVLGGAVSLHEQVGQTSCDTGTVVGQIMRLLCGHAFTLQLPEAMSLPSSSGGSVVDSVPEAPAPTSKKRKYDGNHIPGRFEPRPRIIVTEIDGVEVHTEAPPESTAADAMQRALDGSPIAIDPSLAASQTGMPTHFIDPASLSNTPTTLAKPAATSIFAKPTSEEQLVITLEADLERLAMRFDDLRQECRVIGEARDDAETASAALQKRFDRLLDEVRSLKSERVEMRRELEKLKMPPLPSDEGSLEYLRAENRRLQTELERALKSAESRTQDFDFLRQQYQQSSSAAAELAQEKTALEADIAQLKARAEGGLSHKLAGLQARAARREVEEMCEDLEARNAVLVEQLRRMRDAREAILALQQVVPRGRERTRASSAQEINAVRRRGAATPSNLGVQATTNAATQQLVQQAHAGSEQPTGSTNVTRLSVASLLSPSTSNEDSTPSASVPSGPAQTQRSAAPTPTAGGSNIPAYGQPSGIQQPTPQHPMAGNHLNATHHPQQHQGHYPPYAQPQAIAATMASDAPLARPASPYSTRYGGTFHPYDPYGHHAAAQAQAYANAQAHANAAYGMPGPSAAQQQQPQNANAYGAAPPPSSGPPPVGAYPYYGSYGAGAGSGGPNGSSGGGGGYYTSSGVPQVPPVSSGPPSTASTSAGAGAVAGTGVGVGSKRTAAGAGLATGGRTSGRHSARNSPQLNKVQPAAAAAAATGVGANAATTGAGAGATRRARTPLV